MCCKIAFSFDIKGKNPEKKYLELVADSLDISVEEYMSLEYPVLELIFRDILRLVL